MRKSFLILSLLSAASSVALAYDSRDDAEVARERQNALYAQQGIHSGAFTIFPQLDVVNAYDSNVYKRDDKLGTVDSYVAHFKPGVDVRSNWNRHALNLTFDSDLTQYANQSSQTNYQDLFTRLDGRIDVLRESHVDARFSYNSVHENRSSPDQIFGKSPTFYDTKGIDLFYTHKFNRIGVEAGLDTIRYDYQDVLTTLDTPLLMSTRSHWEHSPSVRVSYEIQPEYEAFLKFIYKEADYDSLVLFNGSPNGIAYNRNSTGYNFLGGLAFDLTDLITGDMSIGYLQRSYADARLPEISGINGFVSLKWRPTALTTVKSKISHDINETTQAGVSGVLATSISLSADHELLRNVLLHMSVDFSNLDYQGFSPGTSNLFNRNDQVYGFNMGANYFLNRNVSAGLGYTYQSRDTNYLLSGYEAHQIMLSLKGQF
jgi:hypothetical protein